MLQVLNNTFIKPIKDYYSLSNNSNLNDNSNNESITCDNLNNDDVDNDKKETFEDFDGNCVPYENVNSNLKWEGYFDKNGQFRSMECKTNEYENARYDAQYIRKNKIFKLIDENNLCKLNYPLIDGSYYISPTNDIYKINWEFYEKLEDILDHSTLFKIINDEQTKNLLINSANEFEKNDKLFKESMKDNNKGVGIDYVIKNVIVPHLEKKKQEQNKNCIIC